MKLRKLVIISPLGLLILACVAVAWWYLGDDDWVKTRVETTVSEMTGRVLKIDGMFSIDWSTTPVLSAEKIRFSNPDWAIHPDLVKLDKLELSINLFSILKGPAKINHLDMVGLVVALEESDTGENSWEIEIPLDETASPDEAELEEIPVVFDRVSIADFSLLHEAPDRTVPLDFNLEQLNLVQRADEQILINTNGILGGEKLELSGDFGPLNAWVAGGRTSHHITLALGDIELQSNGVIEQASTISGANIKLSFSGPEFEWLLTQLALPTFSQGDFEFRLDLQTEGNQTELVLDGDLGSLQAQARGKLSDLEGTGSLQADISGDDFGGLLAVAGVPGVPRTTFDLSANISHADHLIEIHRLTLETNGSEASISGQAGDWPQLADTALDFSVSGTDLQSWGQAWPNNVLPDTDFDLSGSIRRNGLEPASTGTRLRLGESVAQLSGSLGKLPSMTGAELTLTADGPVDGAIVQMLGIEGIPGQVFGLNARIERDTSHLYLREFNFNLADNRLDLNGNLVNWPELNGSHVTFSLEGPDLSIWSQLTGVDALPASTFSLDGEVSKTIRGIGLDKVKLQLGDSRLAVNGTLGKWPGLIGTSLIVEAKGPSLAEFQFVPGAPELPSLPYQVNGKMELLEKGPSFENFSVLIGDNSLRVDGVLGLNDQLAGSQFETRIILPNIADLGDLMGIEGLPGERLSGNGSVQRVEGGWAFQVSDGSFANASFESKGSYLDRNEQQLFEASSSLTSPNLAHLAMIFGVDELPEQAISIEGVTRYDQGRIEVRDLHGTLGDTQFTVFAESSDSATWAQNTITLSASGRNLGQLLDYPVPDDQFNLNVKVQGSAKAFHIEPLDFRLGASDLSGELSVDLVEKPGFNGTFRSSYLDLGWIQGNGESKDDGEEPAKATDRKYLIPDTPVDFSRIDLGDSDVKVTIDKIRFPNRVSSDAFVHGRIENGNLYLDPFQSRGEDGGLLRGVLAVERAIDSEITNVALSLEGQGVQLGIGTVEGQDPATIRQADVTASLSGAGVTYRDLARSLNGHIEVVQGPGLTGNLGLGLIFGNFIGELFDMINPFAKTEEFTVNECAVAVVNVESGIVTIDPVVSQTDKMTMIAKGVVDLHTEKINFTFNTKLRKGIGISASMVINPFVSVTGTLLSPVIGLDPAAVAVKGTIAVATVGISLLARSLTDRYLSSKDPCGDALKKSRKDQGAPGKKKK